MRGPVATRSARRRGWPEESGSSNSGAILPTCGAEVMGRNGPGEQNSGNSSSIHLNRCGALAGGFCVSGGLRNSEWQCAGIDHARLAARGGFNTSNDEEFFAAALHFSLNVRDLLCGDD